MTSQSEATPAEQEQPPAPPTFAELGARPETVEALAAAGITNAFPIQAQTLPVALTGADIIGQAKTGTGKTLGFGVPILERVTTEEEETQPDPRPQALIVAPTRELALQVAGDLEQAGATRRVRVIAIYGGKGYEPQIEALQAGVDIVVGTPGRLLDLHRQRYLDLSGVEVLVLDEADEMLDMGFLPDVEQIVEQVPQRRQTMLFSATMPGKIVSLARRYMDKPLHIRATDSGESDTVVDVIEQHVWRAHAMDKDELLARALQAEGCERTMIFTRTKRRAQRIVDDLSDRGFKAVTVHGDLGQQARERSLEKFRSGQADILVATDVAARGIDIEGVTHVINYECPDDENTYVHRIGRTGRAGSSGVAITLVDWEDTNRWQMINRTLKLAFHEPLETYSTSEHLESGLGVPKEAKGRLPGAKPKQDRERSSGRDGNRSRGGRSGGDSRRGDSRKGDNRSRTRNRKHSGDGDRDGESSARVSSTESDGNTRRRRRRRRPKQESGQQKPTGDGS